MLKQSFCYPCYQSDEVDFNRLCEHAAAIGYAGVELWFRNDQFLPLVQAAGAHGLAVASMCGHTHTNGGLNNPKEHDRIEAEIRESIELAKAHRIANLICFSGKRNEGQSDDEGLDACVEGFKRVAGAAQEAGINLNMELLNSKVNHPGYQADHTAWGVAVCQKVNSPRVKLLYDIYHMQVMEGDVIRTIRDNIQWIGHFHTAGNPGRFDLDDEQELYYPAICRAIVATGYEGYLAHEFRPKGDRLEALREAFRVCSVG
jgi:hydroxypyruvate isomerase